MHQASTSCVEGCTALCLTAAMGKDDMLGMPGGFNTLRVGLLPNFRENAACLDLLFLLHSIAINGLYLATSGC